MSEVWSPADVERDTEIAADTINELLKVVVTLRRKIGDYATDKRRLMGFCMIAYSELEQVSPNYEFLALLEAEIPKWTDEELAKAREKAKEISTLLNWTPS